jgi:MoxR-like ATPase
MVDVRTPVEEAEIQSAFCNLVDQLSGEVVGQREVIRGLVLALLCDGHVLVEGPPGTGKTRAVKTMARYLAADFGRIQFTPDLLPADLTGSDVYTANRELLFQQGPIFNHLILADEINRAPARVQSALLEAMEEKQVTVGTQTYPLPQPFLVMATQNSLDQEGTYPLPEAQLDRFLMKLTVDYPSREADLSILKLQQAEEKHTPSQHTLVGLNQVALAREQISRVLVSDAIEQYIVDLVQATRHPQHYSDQLAAWLRHGVSARAILALHRVARANAWLEGRDYVIPEDVKKYLAPCLAHRLSLSYEALANSVTTRDLIEALIEHVVAH